jgi:hypothetical protein
MSKIRSNPNVFRINQPQIPAARTPAPMNAVGRLPKFLTPFLGDVKKKFGVAWRV